MVGHTFEYNAAVWKLRELVGSGALGRILYVDTARLSLGRYQSDVNVIWDLAPHDISIVSYILDEMPSATAVWAHCNIGGPHADVAYLRLDFARARTQAFVHVSWLNPNKVRQVTVVGEKMMAVYDDMSDNERIRIYDIGVDVATIDDPTAAHALPGHLPHRRHRLPVHPVQRAAAGPGPALRRVRPDRAPAADAGRAGARHRAGAGRDRRPRRCASRSADRSPARPRVRRPPDRVMTEVTIPFLDVVGITDLLAEELELVWKSVLTHGRFVAGPEVDTFEAEFASFCGTTSCVGVGNGTDALELILAGPRDRARRRGDRPGQHVRRHRRGRVRASAPDPGSSTSCRTRWRSIPTRCPQR